VVQSFLNFDKSLFSVSFCIIEVKCDNFSRAVFKLVLEGQVLVNNSDALLLHSWSGQL